MSTLVIHPQDRSTDFLTPIYNNIDDKIVIKGGISRFTLKRLIEQYDRIMMMGHGSPGGLFAVGNWKPDLSHYVIDDDIAKLLRNKECYFIWCNADVFVKQQNLKGFYTGMFISEVGEARWFDIIVNQEVVTQSNDAFAEIASKYNNLPINEFYQKVLQDYGKFAKETNNPVASYNHERLYFT